MKSFVRLPIALLVLSCFGSSVRAEDEENEIAEEVSTDEEVAEAASGEGEGAEEAPRKGKVEKHYHILPYCRLLDGSAEVLRPGATEWEPIREGKFYALGTTYRTSGAETRLIIKFGKEIDVEVKGVASFGTRAQPLDDATRTVVLMSGTITVKLPRNFPDGLFVVTAPGFKTLNPKGNSCYTYTKSPDGDGDSATIRCVTGDLSLEGPHFKVLSMKAANEVNIRTSLDRLFTGLYGSRGDYIVRLDQGTVLVKDFATGETTREEKTLDWKLSPKTAVRIHRSLPALGEKMAVSVMTFDATGELKNRCVFAEQTAEVNSGELGPTSKKEREDIAKKAAEAAETETIEADAEANDVAATTVDEDAPSSDSATSTGDDDLDF